MTSFISFFFEGGKASRRRCAVSGDGGPGRGEAAHRHQWPGWQGCSWLPQNFLPSSSFPFSLFLSFLPLAGAAGADAEQDGSAALQPQARQDARHFLRGHGHVRQHGGEGRGTNATGWPSVTPQVWTIGRSGSPRRLFSWIARFDRCWIRRPAASLAIASRSRATSVRTRGKFRGRPALLLTCPFLPSHGCQECQTSSSTPRRTLRSKCCPTARQTGPSWPPTRGCRGPSR